MEPSSSLGAARRPRRTHGRWSTQFAAAQRARRASFRRRWKRSTIPLDCGSKAVVWLCWMLSRLQRAAHREEVNWAPRYSKAAHPSLKQCIGAVYCCGGVDRYCLRPAGCPVNDSEQVGEPLEAGRGPTRSTWMSLKWREGTRMC